MQDNLEFMLGEMTGAIKIMNENLTLVSSDVKALLSDSAGNKERFASGSRHFERTDLLMANHEIRLNKIEDKRFPWGRVGGLISLGFVVIGFLVAYFK